MTRPAKRPQPATRRQWLGCSAGLLLGGLMPWQLTLAADAQAQTWRDTALAVWRQRITQILDRGGLPIIDMEATYVAGRTNVAYLRECMDALDVAQIVFAAANAPNSQPSLDLYQAHPAYFIPASNSGEFPRWWSDPLAFLAGVGRDLAQGGYAFMGEHEFRHYPSPEQVAAGQTNRDISIALDGPAGHALFQLGEATGIAFQIHYEIEDALLPVLESMLERYPRARVIWCHLAMVRYGQRAGRYAPDYVRSLIARFPGLHFDLAVPEPSHVYKPSGERDATLFRDGRLEPRWLAVLEEHPERFLAASDYRPPVEQSYKASITRQRTLILDVLSERSRHLVAYGNAWRLMTGQDWSR